MTAPYTTNHGGQAMNMMIADQSGSGILSALNSDVPKAQQLILGKTYRMKGYDVSELKAPFRREASVSVQFYIKANTTLEETKENPVDIETVTPLSEAHQQTGQNSYMVLVESVGPLDEKKKTRNGERSFRSIKVWDCSQTSSYRIDLWGHIATIFIAESYEKQVVYFNNLNHTDYNNGGLQSAYNKTFFYISHSKPAMVVKS
ncbi:uncharacterized protein LOC129586179 [Paramacrobiotus metropolitanus]|uniref:uncharacterized protein LOC129586179 n=1 Tax=Paramacrobiotus metropolitanus TaxID=2943436 RepID=UPI0024464E1D|nr:uncharacterized protein LOC129586179 [Paramacrobiotus metropolitanus]